MWLESSLITRCALYSSIRRRFPQPVTRIPRIYPALAFTFRPGFSAVPIALLVMRDVSRCPVTTVPAVGPAMPVPAHHCDPPLGPVRFVGGETASDVVCNLDLHDVVRVDGVMATRIHAEAFGVASRSSGGGGVAAQGLGPQGLRNPLIMHAAIVYDYASRNGQER